MCLRVCTVFTTEFMIYFTNLCLGGFLDGLKYAMLKRTALHIISFILSLFKTWDTFLEMEFLGQMHSHLVHIARFDKKCCTDLFTPK